MDNNPFRDDNPFKPSSYEYKSSSVPVEAPSYDFYPSANTYNSNSASAGYGNASTSANTQDFSFGQDLPSAPPPEPGASDKSILSHPAWTWKFWQSFFDVDTSEVLRRMFFSFAPWPRYLKTESVDVFIGAKPDLYGHFWISSTLIFVIAVLGNIASFFQNYGHCSKSWNYDYHTVSAAAISIYLYVWLLPILIWTFLWWRNSHGTLKLSGALCLYGYSMSLYIPVSFLWLINILWLQWLLALTAAALSGFVLAYVFWNHLHFTHRSLAIIIGLIVFLLHLALGFAFVGSFFRYSPNDACTPLPPMNSTDTSHSTFLTPDPLNFTAHASAQFGQPEENFTLTSVTLSGITATNATDQVVVISAAPLVTVDSGVTVPTLSNTTEKLTVDNTTIPGVRGKKGNIRKPLKP